MDTPLAVNPSARRLTLFGFVLLATSALLLLLALPASAPARVARTSAVRRSTRPSTVRCHSSASHHSHHSARSCAKHHHKKSHTKHKAAKKVAHPSAPPVELVPADCEDGTLPSHSGGGGWSCEDGSAPNCESGTLVRLATTSQPLCAVKAGSEPVCTGEECSTEFDCEDAKESAADGSECERGSAEEESGEAQEEE